jgi:excisionase family DNA binding protein
MIHNGLTTGQAASYLGLHVKTVQRMDRDGILPASRTATGRRYWPKELLDSFLGRTTAKGPQRIVAYCRVSSAGQRPDLKSQRKVLEEWCFARGLANVEFIEEIGGGLNLTRKVFVAIMESVERREIKTLIVAHRDRLCRFGFEWFSRFCTTHGCELLVLDAERLSPEQEMVHDLMTIVHCFSARLYGLRSYRKTLREALKS